MGQKLPSSLHSGLGASKHSLSSSAQGLTLSQFSGEHPFHGSQAVLSSWHTGWMAVQTSERGKQKLGSTSFLNDDKLAWWRTRSVLLVLADLAGGAVLSVGVAVSGRAVLHPLQAALGPTIALGDQWWLFRGWLRTLPLNLFDFFQLSFLLLLTLLLC